MAAAAVRSEQDHLELIQVKTLTQLRQMVATYVSRQAPVYFDTETTGLDPWQGKLIMLQFMQAGRIPVIVDMRRHYCEDYMGYTKRALGMIGEALAPLFNGSCLIVGHNLKFDLNWSNVHLGLSAVKVWDTKIAEQVIFGLGGSDAAKQGVSFHLKDVAARRLGTPLSKEERNWFIDLDKRPDEWAAPFPLETVRYGINDVKVLEPIMELQREELDRRGLMAVAELEMRALPAIASIEQAGVLIDVDGWREVIAEKEVEARQIEDEALSVFGPPILEARAEAFDKKAHEYNLWVTARDDYEQSIRDYFNNFQGLELQDTKWGDFKVKHMREWREKNPNPGKPKPDTSLPNLGSPAQLLTAFEKLGIGKYERHFGEDVWVALSSTDSETLKTAAETFPVLEPLLKFRKAQKFVDAFGESLLKFVDPATGRIHPEYVPIGASTGRMSCSRPNWQQIPSKGDGKRLRALVKAPPGYKLLTGDFSNIELRILADIADDEVMCRFFREGKDLHSETAKLMFNLPAEWTKDDCEAAGPIPGWSYRDVAKTINFGLVYGMSAAKLGRTLKISKQQAQELMDTYFRTYPGVTKWLAWAREVGVRTARSKTLAGRVRFYKLPPEPIRPMTRETPKIKEWMEAHREWEFLKQRIERQACNSPIQGSSADITKLALALIYESGILCKSRIVAVVHDEVVMECRAEDAEEVRAVQGRCMEEAAKTYLKRVVVPKTEIVISDHWSKK